MVRAWRRGVLALLLSRASRASAHCGHQRCSGLTSACVSHARASHRVPRSRSVRATQHPQQGTWHPSALRGGGGPLSLTQVSAPQVKQRDNGVALKSFPRVVRALDALGWADRQLALAQGLLAGNVFDWGAKAVSE